MKFRSRVLIITGSLLIGGVERLIVDTARELLKRGNFRPAICNLSGQQELQPKIESLGCEYYSLNCRSLSKNLIATVRHVREVIKTYRPDIIHTHQFASDFCGVVGSLGLGIPVLFHLHNPQMEPLSRQIVRYILGMWLCSAFIAVTEEKALLWERQVPNSRGRVFVLHNAIDPRNLCLPPGYDRTRYRSGLGIPENAFVIGSVGRLSYEKGYDLLLQAFAQLSREIPSAFLILVGGGKEERQLKGLAQVLGIASRVKFTGYRTDVAALISLFDVFCISSRTEAFPIVALEAMYLGVPLVITDRVSAQDVLSAASLVVPPTVAGLTRGLACLANAHDERRNLALKGRILVERQFTMPLYVSRLEAIYDKVLNRRW